MYWYVHARLGTSRYVQVCEGMYWHRPTCQSHIQVCTSTHNHLLVWDSMYWYVLVCTCMYWYVLVCPGMYWYVLVCTSIYPDFQFTNSVFPRYSIHEDTSKYMEVHDSTGKSCIPGLWLYFKVGRGTSRYKALYCQVPWCTAIIQVYRTFRYCHVLPCTLMYLHVSSNGERRNWWIVKQSKCWYIPV